MVKASEAYAHGRLRQRVVAFGRSRAGRINPARARRNLTKDKYLGPLLQSGTIAPDHLETAIEAYTRAPSTFVWISEVDDAVLDKADRVFLAKYGRWPFKNDDFQLNGHYYKICRSLQHDWRHYDDQLEGQQKADVMNSVSLATVTAAGHQVPTGPRKAGRNSWPFVSVLVAGLLSAPILGAALYWYSARLSAPSIVLAVLVWLALLALALALTLPRDRR